MSDDLDLQLSVPASSVADAAEHAEALAEDPEPCENCGVEVQWIDLLGLARMCAGLDPGEHRPKLCDSEDSGEDEDGGVTLTLQGHTPERCQMLRRRAET